MVGDGRAAQGGDSLICACGQANPPAAKFCLECGSALSLRCPHCDAELPPAAKFCIECGTAPTSTAKDEASPSGVRKVVTVVFVDLAGSTSLQDHMDPESVRRVMDRFYATMRSEIEGAGGLVVKFTGDGVMAGFGIREAREDDALRAMRAAAAMYESFGAFAELAGTTEADLALRVGVNTGEVVVSDGDDDVVGDVVNVAARLEHAAASGTVLVGSETWKLTRDHVTYVPVPPLDLKGKAEPVPAYRLVALQPPGDDHAGVTPFVARQAELARLHDLFEASMAGSKPARITVVGSPGVGKTRLATQFTSSVADRARILEARCVAAGKATYAPIADALREAAGIADTATSDEVVAALDALLPPGAAERERIARLAASLLGAGEPAAPQETFWAVRRLLEGMAAAQAVVLVVDDVQWAEPLLLDLLDHVVDWARDAAIVVVALARPEIRDVRPALVDAGAIQLEGLDPDDTAALASSLLGAQDLPPHLVRRILATTGGNPLFVRELLRMLVDDGVLARDGDRWVVTVESGEVDVPPTIHALLSARIERLHDDERAVVERAAVVGTEFYRGAVVELVPPPLRRGVDGHLETLRREELVEPEGAYWIDERVFRFHHVLIRDAAYRRLLKEARAELHERFADWLQAKVGDLVGEHEEVLGYHLEQAHAYLVELGSAGDDAARLGRRASGHLASAATRALHRDDLVAAAGLAGRALALTDDPDRRAAVLLDRCEALLAMGDVTASVQAIAELRAVSGDDRLRAWVTCFDAQLAILTDAAGLRATAGAVEEAARRLTALGDTTGAAKAHAVHAQALAHLGQFGACEAALDRALGAARAAGDKRRANAVLAGAPLAALWGPSPVPRASGRCLDVVRVLRITAGAPGVEATALRCQAVLEAMRDRTDAARRMLASARETLEELGLRHALVECDLFAGLIELIAGDAAAAEPHLRSAHEGFGALDVGTDTAHAAAVLARALVAQGRDDEALPLTEESERLGGDDLQTAIAWRTVRARILARRGNVEAAIALARSAVALAEPTDALVDHAEARRALADVLAAAGRADDAAAESGRADELLASKVAPGAHGEPAGGATAGARTDGPSHGSAELADWSNGVKLLKVSVPGEAAGFLDIVVADPAGSWAERFAADDGSVFERLDTLAYERSAARPVRDALAVAFNSQDWARLNDLFAPGFDAVTHRRFVLTPARNRTELIEAYRSFAELGGQVESAGIAAVGGTGIGRGRLGGPGSGDGGEFAIGILTVTETDAGRIRRTELFEAEDELGARRRLHELAPSPSFPVWLMRRHFDAHERQDWDVLRSLVAEDITVTDHRTVGWGELHGVDEVLGYLQEGARAGGMRPGSLPIKEWFAVTPDAVLFRSGWEGTSEEGVDFAFDRVGLFIVRDGRFSRADLFDPDQLDDARRLLAAGSHPVLGAVRRVVGRAHTGDWDGVAATFSEGVVYEDYRPLMRTSTVGRSSIVEAVRYQVEGGEDALDLDIVEDRGAAVLVRAMKRKDTAEISLLIVYGIDGDGRLSHCCLFDESDLEAARTRLHDIAGADGFFAAAVRRWQDAFAPGDALDELYAPGFEIRDHVNLAIFDRETHVATVRELASGAVQVGVETIVALGERHGVARVSVSWAPEAGDAGDAEVTAHCAVRLDELGRSRYLETFPADQLHRALVRAEELYLEDGATGEAAAGARRRLTVWRMCDAHNEGDWDAFAAAMAPDMVFVDRRQLGWGVHVGRREFVDLIRAIGARSVRHVWRIGDVYALSDTGGVYSVPTEGVDRDGGRYEQGAIAVASWSGEGVTRFEAFPLDAVDDALTRFGELQREEALGLNAYARVYEHFVDNLQRRDWDTAAAMQAPDIVLDDRRPGLQHVLTGRSGLLHNQRSALDLGYVLGRLDLLATRDDHLALHRVLWTFEGGSEIDMLVVGEMDDQDRIAAWVVFRPEDLDDALAELDARHARGGTAIERAWYRLLAAQNSCDMDALGAVHAPEFVLRDHIFHCELDRDATLADISEVLGARGNFATGRRFLFGERHGVFELHWTREPGGRVGASAVTKWMAVRCGPDGRLLVVEWWDGGDLVDALAGAEELYLEDEATGDEAEWSRRRLDLWRGCLAFNAGDVDGAAVHLEPDFVTVDHRPASLGELISRDGWLEWLRQLAPLTAERRWEIRDVRFERDVVLWDLSGTGRETDGGGFDIPVIGVEVARRRQELFGPEQRDDAERRFRELCEWRVTGSNVS